MKASFDILRFRKKLNTIEERGLTHVGYRT